ncbi:septation ring formation regulator EzrA [Priestia filamentosa]|uniref:Septation ring formation regulator EzrA n=1 Tax=Priestia filamentosa TaxID=1402861 RepID=A0A1X7CQL1_9BACI|nr:septation ring formation regulator EzrA [Priestia filamentosa]AKO94413.1 selenide, water dikinase [Priestia filamentosa]MDT3764702.1 septation ring formation regulator EzrA [Priestia filamentosa]OXS70854.1 septation ring formation regulator EzrA [Priestia filamentosa]WRU95034.1 septation ring formation regulator EzrA [Priestia filamentosa]SMF01150.1 septation ring formation regulator [Priestia filamentosa]
MELAIIIILLIIGFILYGFFLRKKIYREVDRLDSIKAALMSEPVADEIAKVKQLKMTGETEELFESWREKWDNIVAIRLPKMDDAFYEIEELADKYKFRKAKARISSLDEELANIKQDIDTILEELQNLLGSEENNKKTIVEMEELFRETKKRLLAHRYSYGKAEEPLTEKLEKIQKQFVKFNEETENGNYLQASAILMSIEERLAVMTNNLEKIPALFTELQTTIPTQLEELREGYIGMLEEGYILEHLQIEESLEELSRAARAIIGEIEVLNIEEAEASVAAINAKIDGIYDMLEKEARAFQQMNQDIDRISVMIKALQARNHEVKEEALLVQKSYHLTPEELELYQKIDRELKRLTNLYYNIVNKAEQQNIAYSVIFEELEEVLTQLNKVEGIQQAYIEMLQDLRKDELAAKEKIADLRKQLFEARRIVEKSNVPGIPESYREDIQRAYGKIQEVSTKLEEKPLDTVAVNELLEQAVEEVQLSFRETEELIFEAALVERMIQYGNRYRSRHPEVAESLLQAEQAFRQYDYKRAYEEASSALESVEPGSVSSIESSLKEDESLR